MNTNYAAPVSTKFEDTRVPVAEWERLLMVWTLRSLNPSKDGFTTLSFAIQQDGNRYLVVERVDGQCTSDYTHGHTVTKECSSQEKAIEYWMDQVRMAVPPCVQLALPGLVEASASYIETYAIYEGAGVRTPEMQSHARVGGWS